MCPPVLRGVTEAGPKICTRPRHGCPSLWEGGREWDLSGSIDALTLPIASLGHPSRREEPFKRFAPASHSRFIAPEAQFYIKAARSAATFLKGSLS